MNFKLFFHPTGYIIWKPSKSVMLCSQSRRVSFLFSVFLLSILDMQSSPHNQFTFRPLPPPPPPPHACTCARKPPPTVDSLQRRSMTTRSQPSPAAPAPPTSTQDSVHLHNSWVLNSNIPLETRYLSYYSPYYIWILTDDDSPDCRNSFHHSYLQRNKHVPLHTARYTNKRADPFIGTHGIMYWAHFHIDVCIKMQSRA